MAHTSTMKTYTQLKPTVINFIKCGVTGWCLEVMFTSVESIMIRDWRLVGKTSLIMFPIYGMGAMLGPIGNRIDRWLEIPPERSVSVRDRVMRHGMLYMVLIFTAEYLTGAWLRARGMCPWDYTGRNTSINGLIRLDFAPLWFATGLLFEQITKKKGA